MKSEDDKLVEVDDGSLKPGRVVHVVAGRHKGLQVRLLLASQSCSQPLPRVGCSSGCRRNHSCLHRSQAVSPWPV